MSAPNVVPIRMGFTSFADSRCWVTWYLTKGGKKPPRTPNGQRAAKVDDPTTWGTYAGAVAGARSFKTVDSADGGIGIVLGAAALPGSLYLGGIDLDTCRDKKTGELAPWAADIVAALPAYWEVSPSKTGLKGFFFYRESDRDTLRDAFKTHGNSWKKPEYSGQPHPPGIECYIEGRYFTVTHERLPNGRAFIDEIPVDDLLRLIRERGPAFEGSTARRGRGYSGRSEHAMGLGGRMRRNGASPEEIREGIYNDPDAAAWAADHDQRQVERVVERSGFGAELSDMQGFGLNEDGVARAFAARHRNQLRFDHTSGKWFRWTGTHWQREETRLAFDWARNICRDIRLKAAADPAARALAKAITAAAVERFTQADRAFAVASENWDRDPWLLGTPAGTVDLRTGELREARQEDFITKITAVGPRWEFDRWLDCPGWLRFLNEATGGDAELIRFLQQWCGYCLTGITRDHALLFIFGPGTNGKSVFLNTIAGILGDYACAAPMETFTASKFDRHPTEIAMLLGARLVTASETEEGRAWAENRLKQLTGGDPVSARFMHRDFFKFTPQFKLTFIGNNKPRLHNVDTAERRRINMLPFIRTPERVNEKLPEELKREWPGILSWMIEGCQDWEKNGLMRPGVVAEATEAYFSEQDIFGQWLAGCCELGFAFQGGATELYDSYEAYSHSMREPAKSTVWFSEKLGKRGFGKGKDGNGNMFYKGLRPRWDEL